MAGMLFLFHRKLCFRETKTLREDRIVVDGKMSRKRPAAGGEFCKAGFILIA